MMGVVRSAFEIYESRLQSYNKICKKKPSGDPVTLWVYLLLWK